MTPRDDYIDEMANAELTDSAIDLLLEGGSIGPETEALEEFIAAVRSEKRTPPKDVSFMATSLAATARSARPSSPRLVFRRLVIVAVVGALVMAMGGVAVAANGSAPGDFLYGLDRTLESLGVGDGGVDERIEEFESLLRSTDDETAYSVLTAVIEESDEADATKAQQHLEFAATKDSPSATAAQETVALIDAFIESNKGKGIGYDGADFGRFLAQMVRSRNSALGEAGAAPRSEKDLPDQAGPKEDKAGGPPAETGPPENAGSGNNNSSAKADKAGDAKDK